MQRRFEQSRDALDSYRMNLDEEASLENLETNMEMARVALDKAVRVQDEPTHDMARFLKAMHGVKKGELLRQKHEQAGGLNKMVHKLAFGEPVVFVPSMQRPQDALVGVVPHDNFETVKYRTSVTKGKMHTSWLGKAVIDCLPIIKDPSTGFPVLASEILEVEVPYGISRVRNDLIGGVQFAPTLRNDSSSKRVLIGFGEVFQGESNILAPIQEELDWLQSIYADVSNIT